MIRTKYAVAAAIASVLVLHQAFLIPLAAQDALPDTPAATCFANLLEAVNHSDEDHRLAFLKDGFAKNDEQTVERRKKQTDDVRSQLGKLTFKKAVASSDNKITAACETSTGPNVLLTITVTDEAPYKIKSVELEIGAGEPADESPLDAETRTDVIERLAKELRAKYVYPKVGEKMAVAIETSAADGEYDDIDEAQAFAKQLTGQLRDICNDKHLRVRGGSPQRPARSPGRRPVDNHGFVKAEMLPGGIGYLKFNFFSGDKEAQKTASAAMNFLGNSNALIFDLRQNGGGSPDMIAYLSSYLFDEPVHLNSFYNRPTETTTETWTLAEVPGKRFGEDTPVYVLTSSYTFSGAEEFTYNLKNLKRGTIVGETTGGGAHPVMPVTLGKQLYITMPFARAINPITETNWEGVGVKPHVAVSADQALEKAIELAGEETAKVATRETAMKKNKKESVDSEELIRQADELMASQSFADAAELFAKITKLDPENGMAWFRYGYCLHASGDLDKAIEVHQKAAEFDQLAAIATYNLACAYSLKNQGDLVFETLSRAVELGFDDVHQLQGDSDFENVRGDKRFAELVKKLKGDQ